MRWNEVSLLLLLVACGGAGTKTTDTGTTAGDDDDTTPTTDVGGLTEDEFADLFYELYCAEYEACSGDTCPIGTTTPTGTTTQTCDFDPEMAEACLEGEWTCNTDFPGFEYPELPDACCMVCGGTTGCGGTTY